MRPAHDKRKNRAVLPGKSIRWVSRTDLPPPCMSVSVTRIPSHVPPVIAPTLTLWVALWVAAALLRPVRRCLNRWRVPTLVRRLEGTRSDEIPEFSFFLAALPSF